MILKEKVLTIYLDEWKKRKSYFLMKSKRFYPIGISMSTKKEELFTNLIKNILELFQIDKV